MFLSVLNIKRGSQTASFSKTKNSLQNATYSTLTTSINHQKSIDVLDVTNAGVSKLFFIIPTTFPPDFLVTS